ncbi:MAG TPA: hypothetical protein VGK17_06855 [Propionicimonas sp.]|jgi:hypothetical protein
MRLNSWSKVTAGGLFIAASLLLAACTGNEPRIVPTSSSSAPGPTLSPSPTPTPTPTPTVAPEIAEAQAAILEAYRGYWATKVTILADTSVDPGPELETYAVDKALTDVYSSVLDYRHSRIVMVGEPVLSPVVSDIVPGVEGTATIADCVDVTNWQPMFRDTGESAAAPGQATRVAAKATAYFYLGHWTIRAYVVDRTTPC